MNTFASTWGNALAVKLKDNRRKEEDSFIVEVYKLPDVVTPVENFIVSRKVDKKDGYNKNIFIENVLKSSKYIRANNNEIMLVAEKGGSFDFLIDPSEDIYTDNDLKVKYKWNKE